MSAVLATTTNATTGSQVLGIGSHLPDRVVSSAELAPSFGLEASWIHDRVGIVERRFAAAGETLVDLAVAAGTKALADAEVDGAEVDAVIVATCSLKFLVPNASARVAQRIGAEAAGAFDVNAACAGFCYGLATGSDLVRAGSARYVLVVGAEKMTDIVDPQDRDTALIFGDGAGAVLVGRSRDLGIGPPAWSNHGGLAGALYQQENGYVAMDGQAVFRWATRNIPKLALRALDAAGVTLQQVDAVIMHQANLQIIRLTEAFLRAEGLRNDAIVADDVRYSGNTSAASVPIALDNLRRGGRLKPGAVVLLAGVGAGMTGAAQIMLCP